MSYRDSLVDMCNRIENALHILGYEAPKMGVTTEREAYELIAKALEDMVRRQEHPL